MDHSQSTTWEVIWDGSVIILGAQRLEAGYILKINLADSDSS